LIVVGGVRQVVPTEVDVRDWMREHLLTSLGYPHPSRRDQLPLDELWDTEWPVESRSFVAMMRRRKVIGAFRYGREGTRRKRSYDLVAGMRKKLAAYEESGNTENLVDLANYCEMEFRAPSHPDAHFRAEDDRCHCPPAAK